MWTLGQNLGSGVGRAEIAFCLTVPSEWGETSRQNYLKDFQKSLKTVGLNTNAQVILVTESVRVSALVHK
jgi:adenosylcobinamide amidohydrolase